MPSEFRYQFEATICVSVNAETEAEALAQIKEWHKQSCEWPVRAVEDPDDDSDRDDGEAYAVAAYLDNNAEPELIDCPVDEAV